MRIWWILLLLLFPAPAYAISPTVGTGITLYGGERLTSTGADTLRGLLMAMPVSLYPHLEAITVDSTPATPTGVSCEHLFPGPCLINIWSDNETVREDPFPSDAPVRTSSSVYYATVAHELGHWVSLNARLHRGGWEFNLVNEAGCDANNYLRSMFARCFFRDYPQEFTASMVNQWATCSECTLRLALARWDAGITHPLNQAVYLMWLFGALPSGDVDGLAGHVLTYRERDGQPVVTIWTVRPWRCGGDVTIAGPTLALTLTLDPACRVTAIGAREGL